MNFRSFCQFQWLSLKKTKQFLLIPILKISVSAAGESAQTLWERFKKANFSRYFVRNIFIHLFKILKFYKSYINIRNLGMDIITVFMYV